VKIKKLISHRAISVIVLISFLYGNCVYGLPNNTARSSMLSAQSMMTLEPGVIGTVAALYSVMDGTVSADSVIAARDLFARLLETESASLTVYFSNTSREIFLTNGKFTLHLTRKNEPFKCSQVREYNEIQDVKVFMYPAEEAEALLVQKRDVIRIEGVPQSVKEADVIMEKATLLRRLAELMRARGMANANNLSFALLLEQNAAQSDGLVNARHAPVLTDDGRGLLFVDGVPGLEEYVDKDEQGNNAREVRNAERIRDHVLALKSGSRRLSIKRPVYNEKKKMPESRDLPSDLSFVVWDKNDDDRCYNDIFERNFGRLLERLPVEDANDLIEGLKAASAHRPIVMSILDQSRHWFEDCRKNRIVGGNRFVFENIVSAMDILEGDPSNRDAKDILEAYELYFQTYLYHELRHEAMIEERKLLHDMEITGKLDELRKSGRAGYALTKHVSEMSAEELTELIANLPDLRKFNEDLERRMNGDDAMYFARHAEGRYWEYLQVLSNDGFTHNLSLFYEAVLVAGFAMETDSLDVNDSGAARKKYPSELTDDDFKVTPRDGGKYDRIKAVYDKHNNIRNSGSATGEKIRRHCDGRGVTPCVLYELGLSNFPTVPGWRGKDTYPSFQEYERQLAKECIVRLIDFLATHREGKGMSREYGTYELFRKISPREYLEELYENAVGAKKEELGNLLSSVKAGTINIYEAIKNLDLYGEAYRKWQGDFTKKWFNSALLRHAGFRVSGLIMTVSDKSRHDFEELVEEVCRERTAAGDERFAKFTARGMSKSDLERRTIPRIRAMSLFKSYLVGKFRASNRTNVEGLIGKYVRYASGEDMSLTDNSDESNNDRALVDKLYNAANGKLAEDLGVAYDLDSEEPDILRMVMHTFEVLGNMSEVENRYTNIEGGYTEDDLKKLKWLKARIEKGDVSSIDAAIKPQLLFLIHVYESKTRKYMEVMSDTMARYGLGTDLNVKPLSDTMRESRAWLSAVWLSRAYKLFCKNGETMIPRRVAEINSGFSLFRRVLVNQQAGVNEAFEDTPKEAVPFSTSPEINTPKYNGQCDMAVSIYDADTMRDCAGQMEAFKKAHDFLQVGGLFAVTLPSNWRHAEGCAESLLKMGFELCYEKTGKMQVRQKEKQSLSESETKAQGILKKKKFKVFVLRKISNRFIAAESLVLESAQVVGTNGDNADDGNGQVRPDKGGLRTFRFVKDDPLSLVESNNLGTGVEEKDDGVTLKGIMEQYDSKKDALQERAEEEEARDTFGADIKDVKELIELLLIDDIKDGTGTLEECLDENESEYLGRVRGLLDTGRTDLEAYLNELNLLFDELEEKKSAIERQIADKKEAERRKKEDEERIERRRRYEEERARQTLEAKQKIWDEFQPILNRLIRYQSAVTAYLQASGGYNNYLSNQFEGKIIKASVENIDNDVIAKAKEVEKAFSEGMSGRKDCSTISDFETRYLGNIFKFVSFRFFFQYSDRRFIQGFRSELESGVAVPKNGFFVELARSAQLRNRLSAMNEEARYWFMRSEVGDGREKDVTIVEGIVGKEGDTVNYDRKLTYERFPAVIGLEGFEAGNYLDINPDMSSEEIQAGLSGLRAGTAIVGFDGELEIDDIQRNRLEAMGLKVLDEYDTHLKTSIEAVSFSQDVSMDILNGFIARNKRIYVVTVPNDFKPKPISIRPRKTAQEKIDHYWMVAREGSLLLFRDHIKLVCKKIEREPVKSVLPATATPSGKNERPQTPPAKPEPRPVAKLGIMDELTADGVTESMVLDLAYIIYRAIDDFENPPSVDSLAKDLRITTHPQLSGLDSVVLGNRIGRLIEIIRFNLLLEETYRMLGIFMASTISEDLIGVAECEVELGGDKLAIDYVGLGYTTDEARLSALRNIGLDFWLGSEDDEIFLEHVFGMHFLWQYGLLEDGFPAEVRSATEGAGLSFNLNAKRYTVERAVQCPLRILDAFRGGSTLSVYSRKDSFQHEEKSVKKNDAYRDMCRQAGELVVTMTQMGIGELREINRVINVDMRERRDVSGIVAQLHAQYAGKTKGERTQSSFLPQVLPPKDICAGSYRYFVYGKGREELPGRGTNEIEFSKDIVSAMGGARLFNLSEDERMVLRGMANDIAACDSAEKVEALFARVEGYLSYRNTVNRYIFFKHQLVKEFWRSSMHQKIVSCMKQTEENLAKMEPAINLHKMKDGKENETSIIGVLTEFYRLKQMMEDKDMKPIAMVLQEKCIELNVLLEKVLNSISCGKSMSEKLFALSDAAGKNKYHDELRVITASREIPVDSGHVESLLASFQTALYYRSNIFTRLIEDASFRGKLGVVIATGSSRYAAYADFLVTNFIDTSRAEDIGSVHGIFKAAIESAFKAGQDIDGTRLDSILLLLCRAVKAAVKKQPPSAFNLYGEWSLFVPLLKSGNISADNLRKIGGTLKYLHDEALAEGGFDPSQQAVFSRQFGRPWELFEAAIAEMGGITNVGGTPPGPGVTPPGAGAGAVIAGLNGDAFTESITRDLASILMKIVSDVDNPQTIGIIINDPSIQQHPVFGIMAKEADGREKLISKVKELLEIRSYNLQVYRTFRAFVTFIDHIRPEYFNNLNGFIEADGFSREINLVALGISPRVTEMITLLNGQEDSSFGCSEEELYEEIVGEILYFRRCDIRKTINQIVSNIKGKMAGGLPFELSSRSVMVCKLLHYSHLDLPEGVSDFRVSSGCDIFESEKDAERDIPDLANLYDIATSIVAILGTAEPGNISKELLAQFEAQIGDGYNSVSTGGKLNCVKISQLLLSWEKCLKGEEKVNPGQVKGGTAKIQVSKVPKKKTKSAREFYEFYVYGDGRNAVRDEVEFYSDAIKALKDTTLYEISDDERTIINCLAKTLVDASTEKEITDLFRQAEVFIQTRNSANRYLYFWNVLDRDAWKSEKGTVLMDQLERLVERLQSSNPKIRILKRVMSSEPEEESLLALVTEYLRMQQMIKDVENDPVVRGFSMYLYLDSILMNERIKRKCGIDGIKRLATAVRDNPLLDELYACADIPGGLFSQSDFDQRIGGNMVKKVEQYIDQNREGLIRFLTLSNKQVSCLMGIVMELLKESAKFRSFMAEIMLSDDPKSASYAYHYLKYYLRAESSQEKVHEVLTKSIEAMLSRERGINFTQADHVFFMLSMAIVEMYTYSGHGNLDLTREWEVIIGYYKKGRIGKDVLMSLGKFAKYQKEKMSGMSLGGVAELIEVFNRGYGEPWKLFERTIAEMGEPLDDSGTSPGPGTPPEAGGCAYAVTRERLFVLSAKEKTDIAGFVDAMVEATSESALIDYRNDIVMPYIHETNTANRLLYFGYLLEARRFESKLRDQLGKIKGLILGELIDKYKHDELKPYSTKDTEKVSAEMIIHEIRRMEQFMDDTKDDGAIKPARFEIEMFIHSFALIAVKVAKGGKDAFMTALSRGDPDLKAFAKDATASFTKLGGYYMYAPAYFMRTKDEKLLRSVVRDLNLAFQYCDEKEDVRRILGDAAVVINELAPAEKTFVLGLCEIENSQFGLYMKGLVKPNRSSEEIKSRLHLLVGQVKSGKIPAAGNDEKYEQALRVLRGMQQYRSGNIVVKRKTGGVNIEGSRKMPYMSLDETYYLVRFFEPKMPQVNDSEDDFSPVYLIAAVGLLLRGEGCERVDIKRVLMSSFNQPQVASDAMEQALTGKEASSSGRDKIITCLTKSFVSEDEVEAVCAYRYMVYLLHPTDNLVRGAARLSSKDVREEMFHEIFTKCIKMILERGDNMDYVKFGRICELMDLAARQGTVSEFNAEELIITTTFDVGMINIVTLRRIHEMTLKARHRTIDRNASVRLDRPQERQLTASDGVPPADPDKDIVDKVSALKGVELFKLTEDEKEQIDTYMDLYIDGKNSIDNFMKAYINAENGVNRFLYFKFRMEAGTYRCDDVEAAENMIEGILDSVSSNIPELKVYYKNSDVKDLVMLLKEYYRLKQMFRIYVGADETEKALSLALQIFIIELGERIEKMLLNKSDLKDKLASIGNVDHDDFVAMIHLGMLEGVPSRFYYRLQHYIVLSADLECVDDEEKNYILNDIQSYLLYCPDKTDQLLELIAQVLNDDGLNVADRRVPQGRINKAKKDFLLVLKARFPGYYPRLVDKLKQCSDNLLVPKGGRSFYDKSAFASAGVSHELDRQCGYTGADPEEVIRLIKADQLARRVRWSCIFIQIAKGSIREEKMEDIERYIGEVIDNIANVNELMLLIEEMMLNYSKDANNPRMQRAYNHAVKCIIRKIGGFADSGEENVKRLRNIMTSFFSLLVFKEYIGVGMASDDRIMRFVVNMFFSDDPKESAWGYQYVLHFITVTEAKDGRMRESAGIVFSGLEARERLSVILSERMVFSTPVDWIRFRRIVSIITRCACYSENDLSLRIMRPFHDKLSVYSSLPIYRPRINSILNLTYKEELAAIERVALGRQGNSFFADGLPESHIQSQTRRIVSSPNGDFWIAKRIDGWYRLRDEGMPDTKENRDYRGNENILGGLNEAGQYDNVINQAIDELAGGGREFEDLRQFEVWVLKGVNFSGHYAETKNRIYVPLEILEVFAMGGTRHLVSNPAEFKAYLKCFVAHEYLHVRCPLWNEERVVEEVEKLFPGVYSRVQERFREHVIAKMVSLLGKDKETHYIRQRMEKILVGDSSVVLSDARINQILWLIERTQGTEILPAVAEYLGLYLDESVDPVMMLNRILMASELLLQYLDADQQMVGRDNWHRVNSGLKDLQGMDLLNVKETSRAYYSLVSIYMRAFRYIVSDRDASKHVCIELALRLERELKKHGEKVGELISDEAIEALSNLLLERNDFTIGEADAICRVLRVVRDMIPGKKTIVKKQFKKILVRYPVLKGTDSNSLVFGDAEETKSILLTDIDDDHIEELVRGRNDWLPIFTDQSV